jgi:ribosomal protein L7/L12
VAKLNDQDRKAIETAIYAGRKIEAIKLYREATGGGLADAKRAVEDLEVDLRRREPNKFAQSAGKSGCMSLVAVVALLVSAASVTVYILRS